MFILLYFYIRKSFLYVLDYKMKFYGNPFKEDKEMNQEYILKENEAKFIGDMRPKLIAKYRERFNSFIRIYCLLLKYAKRTFK
jgi:hypothetical protein